MVSSPKEMVYVDGLSDSRQIDADGLIEPDPNVTVEKLMYKYGSDKSKDDHSYTDVYDLVLGPRRKQTRAILEVGIAAGQSIQAWHDYFPNAEINGLQDKPVHKNVQENLDKLPRTITFSSSLKSSLFSVKDEGDSGCSFSTP